VGSGPGPPKPQTIMATILIEPGAESPDRLRGYVVSAVKNACRNIRDGTVVIVLHDEDDNLIGMDVSGTPSVTLQKEFDDLMERYSPDNGDPR
jgi:hypothetical protein